MAIEEWDLVPGPRFRWPGQAIRSWEPSDSVTAAVAFVTSGGVRDLVDLVGADLSRLELTVRAAPLSEPRALLALEDAGHASTAWLACGKEISSRTLARAHGRPPDGASGSANLTTPALTQNQEQMELFSVSADSDAAVAHRHRLAELVVGRLSLAELTGTPYWERWEELDPPRQGTAGSC